MRTIVDIPAAQLERLDRHCDLEGISRAEAVRRAVTALLARQSSRGTEAAYGLWRDRGIDGLECERRIRAEWDDVATAAEATKASR